MKANPLLGAQPAPDPAADDKDKRVVKLVTNAPPGDISGLDDFLKVFNTTDARAEITQYRYTIQRRVKRAMGGKFAKGLSTEVTENVEINLNEDLLGLKRWLAAIRQDPSSVMLLNIHKIKEDALAAPLIFSEMLKTGRPILVSGAGHSERAQLLASIDPTFAKVPSHIEADPQLKEALLARVQRRKGFIQSVRNLVEFEFLPDNVQKLIKDINTGADPSKLSQPEIINFCLLSDIASRYRSVLTQFRAVMEGATMQVPQIMAMFELLLADIPLSQTIAAYKEFIDEEKVEVATIPSKSRLFGNIYQFITTDDGSSRTGRMDRLSRFQRCVSNTFIKHRIRIDPFLWKHSHFLGETDKAEKTIIEGFKPFFKVMQKLVRSEDENLAVEGKKQIAVQVLDLIQMANKSPSEMKSEVDFVRHGTANRLLSLMHQDSGHAFDMGQYVEGKEKKLLQPQDLIVKFMELPLTVDDLKSAVGKLRPALFVNEMVVSEIQKSTLDVINLATQAREKALRDIYVLNALSELVSFPFHLGEKGLSNIDRVCGINVSQTRLGLEVTANPTHELSIGLFTTETDVPFGKLQNDPGLLRLAYTELIGMRVEKLVKKAVDKKINYLQNTYGSNFFEVIYSGVVTDNNLPLSRNQFATFIKSRRIMGNLDAKGWKPGNENDLNDPFLLFLENRSDLHKMKIDSGMLDNFDRKMADISTRFRKLLNEVKNKAEENQTEFNPNILLWGLFKQGIYNMSRREAKLAFRKSVFFKNLQELIARISSENFSAFTKGIVEGGIRIFIPWKYSYLQLIGSRFSFIVGDQVVKYQLLSSPTEDPEDLDEVSRLLYQSLDNIFSSENKKPEVQALVDMGELIEKTNLIWRDYSRNLAVLLMDRILSETIIKTLKPGRIGIDNLWYLADHTKLGLGKSVISSESVPFTKILQVPENMGNIVKYPKSSSTTIDDFAIQVHKIGTLQEELTTTCGIAEDVLDIIQSIAHERSEAPVINKYEQALHQIVRVLGKRLRHITEKDVQTLHVLAKQIKELMQTVYGSPSSQKQKFTTRLQSHLQARRSDGHSLRLNFTDNFVLDKTEIKITRSVKRGDEIVKRQKKVEVEVEATHQTLPLRIREMINFQDILRRKKHLIFSPEGHKKKQVEYCMDIIDVLLTLRGNALTFYVDTSAISEEQVDAMAKRIKPHNFFDMAKLKPEPAEGMKVTVEMDPLTGRAVPTAARAATERAQAQAAEAKESAARDQAGEPPPDAAEKGAQPNPS